MKVVLDTNVVISGIFFSGPPARIMKAWAEGRLRLAVSIEIFEEYRRVARELQADFPEVDIDPILELVLVGAEISAPRPLPERVCSDPADDKFLACALASGSKVVVSGDKALLRVSGYRGIEVLVPRRFLERHRLG
jgi:putative PIN family toxin of toxin-antitoxin system